MSSEAGEDLSWWWRGWYQHNWTLDLGVQSAAYVDHDPAKGLAVTLVNKGWLVMPATLAIALANGTTTTVSVPVESWMKGDTVQVVVPTVTAVRSVTLDPDHRLPDTDRGNDTVAVAP